MTLRSVKELEGYSIRATDDQIGSVHEFLFDDDQWTIRYMVVDTGGWLSGRKVLISPIALGTADWQAQALSVNLSRQQVEESPDITTEQPVSRQHELELANYYGYRPYWGGGGLWGMGMYPVGLWGATTVGAGPLGVPPGAPPSPGLTATEREVLRSQEQQGDPHLRSTREVNGYTIQAIDDDIGHVDDFIVDDESWTLRYFVIDTGNWWPGKRVLLAPAWMRSISWEDRAVYVDLHKEQIKNGPEYDLSRMPNREDEERLHQHYKRRAYWEELVNRR